ncbi:MAG: hypothetical protein Q8P49_01990 [Candidatus Liptonbacteria bacterium]|nr:hypothetical protein [Candidatus Liptonbacteria bacterium]
MDKSTLLRELGESLAAGDISPEEVRELVAASSPRPESRGFNISGVLYYIGGGIVFLGLAIFIGQQWDNLGSAMRILFTLGAGIAFFWSAILLDISKKIDRVPAALHFIAGLLIPGGVFVTLMELGYEGSNFGPGIIFAALALLYVFADRLYPKVILPAFAILYGTFATFLLTEGVVKGMPFFDRGDFDAYRALGVGAAYLFLGHALRDTTRSSLSPWLYGFGTLAVLGSTLVLSGFEPNQSLFWEVIYPGLVFGAMFLAVYLRSRVMLFLGAIFLVADVFKLTAEYFEDSLGWPLMLMLAGFLLIGVGYLTFYVNRKYISR